MKTGIILAVIAIVIIFIIVQMSYWAQATRKILSASEERIDNALNQLGMQLTGCLDVLNSMVVFAETFDHAQTESLKARLRSEARPITATTRIAEIQVQKTLVTQAIDQLMAFAGGDFICSKDQEFDQLKKAAFSYQNMVETSCLIYNDSVENLNHELTKLPARVMAPLMGYRSRQMLDAAII